MGKGTSNAQSKAAKDYRASKKQGAIDSLFSPKYSPPSGKEQAYKDSWKNADKQDKKNRSKKSWW
jgi:hypothetical protein